MRVATISFALLASASLIGGYMLVWTPWLGFLLSYAAPVLAVLGLACGLAARRGARRDGESSRTATAATVTNLGIIPIAALVALTCGTINGVGSLAIAVVFDVPAAAVEVAPTVIDVAIPPQAFWGPGGGYLPNPFALAPTEQEGPVREAVRRTVVSVAALAIAYVWIRGLIEEDDAPSISSPDPPRLVPAYGSVFSGRVQAQ